MTTAGQQRLQKMDSFGWLVHPLVIEIQWLHLCERHTDPTRAQFGPLMICLFHRGQLPNMAQETRQNNNHDRPTST